MNIHAPVWLALSWATCFLHCFPDNSFPRNTLELMSCEALFSSSCGVINNGSVGRRKREHLHMSHTSQQKKKQKKKQRSYSFEKLSSHPLVCFKHCVNCVLTCCTVVSMCTPLSGLPSLQKEKVSTFKADEGSNITLKCNPPESSMVPVIHWMDWSECIIFAALFSSDTFCLLSETDPQTA